MQLFNFLKVKKIFFLQVFLTLYFVINLVGGERGLVSYFEKSNYEVATPVLKCDQGTLNKFISDKKAGRIGDGKSGPN